MRDLNCLEYYQYRRNSHRERGTWVRSTFRERRSGNGNREHFRSHSVKIHPKCRSSFPVPRSSIHRSGNFGDYAGAAAVSIRRSSAAATHFNAKGQRGGGVAEHAIVVVVANSR